MAWPRLLQRALLVLAPSLLLAPSALAQTADPGFWVTNGSVFSVTRAANTVYVGGFFSRVGPASGHGVPIDLASGALPASFPKVNGVVYACIPDGSGGWYIGGSFTTVGGVHRLGLAQVAGDFTVTSWDPCGPTPNVVYVYALAKDGSTVYVGGEFTSIAGTTRVRAAAVDAVTGSLSGWDPHADNTVFALAVGPSAIYAGGAFLNIGGRSTPHVAALDKSSGGGTGPIWSGADDIVDALAYDGGALYAGGSFATIGGQPRSCLAALDGGLGTALTWNPNPAGGAPTGISAIAVSGSTVYAGGAFTTIGGQSRSNLAALSSTTGLATSWNPGANSKVNALAVAGSTVYAGGSFSAIGSASRSCIAALDATTGLATAWDPDLGNPALALGIAGSNLFAGGTFDIVGGLVRNNVAAFDATTGAATAWNPNANNTVLTLLVDGASVYAGGSFSNIGGQNRARIAALDATTGLASDWNPGATGGSGPINVRVLAKSGSTVYAGGNFTFIGGTSRNNLAALDEASGLATPWNPNVTPGSPFASSVDAIVLAGSTAYVGGYFTNAGGQPRNRIAEIDLATGLATGWNPNADGEVNALAFNGATVYAGGNFATIGGPARNHLAEIDATTGAATAWDPNANGVVHALLQSGSAIYVGGSFGSVGGQSRDGIAEIDAATGLAMGWNPFSAGDHFGAYSLGFYSLCASGSSLYAGGVFNRINGGVPLENVAALSSDVTGVAPRAEPAISTLRGWPNPFVSHVTVGFHLTRPTSVRLRVLDVNGRLVWRSGEMALAAGPQTLSWDGQVRGRAVDAGIYFVEVTGPDLLASTRVVRMR